MPSAATLDPGGLAPGTIDFTSGVLTVAGTSAADRIQLLPAGRESLKLVTNFGRMQVSRLDLKEVRVYGGDGNDRITLTPLSADQAALVDGGAGNDRITTGRGADLIVGGLGNDTLTAGAGNDVLLGGAGRDLFRGNAGSDLLLGGDLNADAGIDLLGVRSDWLGAQDPAAKTALGKGLQSAVIDDNTADVLTGGADIDLFFANAFERITDRRAADLVIEPPLDQASIDRFILQKMQEAHLAGASVALVRGDAVLLSQGYGSASIEQGHPMTADTPLMLASVSKTVTAVAAMQLVEAGKLDLDRDINDYLPFAVHDPASPDVAITARMLMTHTSGIIDSDSFADVAYSDGDSPISLGSLMHDYLTPGARYYSRDNFLNAAPGEQAEYSNMGVALLGYLVEVIAGQPFDQYCNDNIFTPLGMSDTSWKLAGLNADDVAMPYEYRAGRFVALGNYGFPDYPNGQLRSSANDMSRFLRAFMDGGELDNVRILSAASVAEMKRLQIPDLDDTQGLIWYYDQVDGHQVFGHNGGEQGVNTYMFFNPQNNVGVLVFSNTSAASTSIQDLQDNAVLDIAAELFKAADQL